MSNVRPHEASSSNLSMVHWSVRRCRRSQIYASKKAVSCLRERRFRLESVASENRSGDAYHLPLGFRNRRRRNGTRGTTVFARHLSIHCSWRCSAAVQPPLRVTAPMDRSRPRQHAVAHSLVLGALVHATCCVRNRSARLAEPRRASCKR